MIEDILPKGAVSSVAMGDDSTDYLFPAEAMYVEHAVEARRREFATGRKCARCALGKLGILGLPILAGPNREPVWPQGFVGSITHCQGYRAAAVASKVDVVALGIDAEPHIGLPLGISTHALVKQELSWLSSAPKAIHWDRVIFSAKESVFKATYPLLRVWLDFKDVQILLDPNRGRFQAQTFPGIKNEDLSKFEGSFRVANGLIVTCFSLLKAADATF